VVEGKREKNREREGERESRLEVEAYSTVV
jgi:hypothetical protein